MSSFKWCFLYEPHKIYIIMWTCTTYIVHTWCHCYVEMRVFFSRARYTAYTYVYGIIYEYHAYQKTKKGIYGATKKAHAQHHRMKNAQNDSVWNECVERERSPVLCKISCKDCVTLFACVCVCFMHIDILCVHLDVEA